MNWIPVTVLAMILSAAGAIAARLHRKARYRGSSRSDAFAGSILMFTAIAMTVSASAHIGANVGSRLLEPAPVYDFRIYSLVFLGVFLFANALTCLRAAARVAACDGEARSRANAALVRLLLTSVPLLPFVPHAWYFSVFAMADLVLLHHAARSARPFAIRRLTPSDCDTLSVHENSLSGAHNAALPGSLWTGAARMEQR